MEHSKQYEGLQVPADGRQSETALRIQKGTCRHLRALGFSTLPELTLKSGRRADLISINDKGEIWIIEIKSSVEDFRVDQKWPEYRDYCDRFFFATIADVPEEIFPQSEGFILADEYGADILRDAPLVKLAAARRKAVTLRFAQAAANRLHRLTDPTLSELL
ncbi:MAG: hypothetical protein COB90_08910 [Hyphomicrobiales bacterium]|nr:MAG: hypothetical protein COB90_08910 [Hyphomicrobiales bacterium]